MSLYHNKSEKITTLQKKPTELQKKLAESVKLIVTIRSYFFFLRPTARAISKRDNSLYINKIRLSQLADLPLLAVSGFRVVNLLRDKFQLRAGVSLHRPIKTRPVANVALARIDRNLQNQAVLVAINQYLLDFLKMPALFALFP